MAAVARPASDQFELSLFGPGFGESIVVHLGSGQWMIVDSCIHSDSGRPAALHYLDALGVSYESVCRIVATHWHDDHVRGLGQVITACPNADFWFSGMLQRTEFQELVEVGRESMMSTSGTSEFSRVMSILEERRRRTGRMPRHFAGPRQLIWERGDDQVRSLSPSDRGVEEMIARIVEILPEPRVIKRRIGDLNPNHASVVLWIRVGKAVVLLGADLQRRRDPDVGWKGILNDPVRPPDKASVFKVPHHGSQNGYEERVWTELLDPDPIAMVTPFARWDLPTPEDVVRLCQLTSDSYITSAPSRPPTRTRPEPVQEMIAAVTSDIHEAENPTGQIRLRRSPRESSWTLELFTPARRLCE
jgi:beta-lactamase superfamily II metal-dependent hydrolase